MTQAKSALLEAPEPIAIPEGFSIEVIDTAISGALAESGWLEENNNHSFPGSLKAIYLIRTHVIELDIQYDKESITFSYRDSENMDFKEKKNKRYIHSNYKVWTSTLANKIKSNLELGEAYSYNKSLLSQSLKSNIPPTKAFSSYSSFRLMPTTLAKAFQVNEGNLATQRNLDHNLNLEFQSFLSEWNTNTEGGNTLIIEPHIKAVRFIGTSARLWAGRMAGRSWIYVSVSYTDSKTGETIAKPELYRLATAANGFSLARRDYKMVEDMAFDILEFTRQNYEKPVGGGQTPPANIVSEYSSPK